MPESANTAPVRHRKPASSLADLPIPVTRGILDRVSNRRIAGAQLHAAVSKLWHQLAAGDFELLHLLVQQETITAADAARVVSYLQLHGQHVLSLHLLGCVPGTPSVLQQALSDSSACLSNLRSLVLDHKPTFLELSPYLPRLSRLQHLTASVSVEFHKGYPEAVLIGPDITKLGTGVPRMAHVCHASLTSLTLHVHGGSAGRDINLESRMRHQLPRGLQRLQLVAVGAGDGSVKLHRGTLRHLSHLRHLSLQSVMPAAASELHELNSLEELALSSGFWTLDDLASLSDKVTAYSHVHSQVVPISLALFTALTTLTFEAAVGAEAAAAVAPLTRLQHLHLCGMRHHTDASPLLASLSSITSLRRLRLEGWMRAEQVSNVAQLTRLTSLAIGQLFMGNPETSPANHGLEQQQQQQQQQAEGVAGPGPQQEEQRQHPGLQLVQSLRGLRHLEIPEELLLEAGAQQMLDALPALTRLDLYARGVWYPRHQECWGALRKWLEAGPAQQQQQQQQPGPSAAAAEGPQGQQLGGVALRLGHQQQQEEVVEGAGAGILLGGTAAQQQEEEQQQRGRQLQHVVLFVDQYMGQVVAPPGEVLPSPLPGVRVTVWHDEPTLQDEVLLPRCCFPAIKGVWEMAG